MYNRIFKGEDKEIFFRIKDTNASQKETWTLTSATAGVIVLQIDGKNYYESFDTDISTTLTNFKNNNAAELLDNEVILTNTSTTLVFFVINPARTVTIKAISAGTGGTFSQAVNQGFLDLSTAGGIIVHITDQRDQIVQKYSKATITGYEDITIEDEANGKFSIKLQSAYTKDAYPGYIKAEVKIETTNVTFDGSIIHEVNVSDIAEIVNSNTKSITDLTP